VKNLCRASGNKNIGIALLMPGGSRGIEFHFSGLGVEGKLEFACLVLDAWFRSISTFLGKLDVESTVPEFPCSVGQLHHPDIWEAAGGPVTTIGAKVVQWQLPLVFDKSRCQPIFQIGFLKVVQDFRYDHWYKELVRPFTGSQSAWLWLPSSPLYLNPT
jgi:hypothetical protein